MAGIGSCYAAQVPLTIENALREPGLEPFDLDEGVLTRYRATRRGFIRRLARSLAVWALLCGASIFAILLLRQLPGNLRVGDLMKGIVLGAVGGACIRLFTELLPRLFRVSRGNVIIRGRRPVVILFNQCRLARVADDLYRADFVRRDLWGAEYVALSVGVMSRDVEKLAAAAGASVPSRESAAAQS